MRAVDLFAGAGGLSEGAAMAGVEIVAASNHWDIAVRSHAANHPRALHLCQDISTLNATRLPPHDLLLAAPACQGHSPARGKDRPHHDESRATAWAVRDVAAVTLPRLLLVENVPAFRQWVDFDLWCTSLGRIGYRLSFNVVEASEFGVPQERRRLIILGVRGGKAAPVLRSPGRRAAPASEVIDWKAGRWTPVNDHVPATIARAAAGRHAFGRRFVMPYYGSGSGATGRSIDRPFGTFTCIARWAVVDGDQMRMVSIPEVKRGMSFRPDYQLFGTLRDQHKQLGNAVPPLLARGVVEQVLEAA